PCKGKPFNFHPEYSTASQQNQVPWAALEGGVLMQQEIGHFESCSGVAHPLGLLPYDPQTYWTCMGGREPGGTGEGPCDFSTGTCTNPTTEGGGSCPSGAFNCEFSDALCAPATPTHRSSWRPTWPHRRTTTTPCLARAAPSHRALPPSTPSGRSASRPRSRGAARHACGTLGTPSRE